MMEYLRTFGPFALSVTVFTVGYVWWVERRVERKLKELNIDDLAKLNDKHLEALVHEAKPADLCLAMIAASENTWGRICSKATRHELDRMVEELTAMHGITPRDVKEAELRILRKALEVFSRSGS